MQRVPISLATGSSPGRHGPEGKARHVNCYLEPIDQGKHQFAIYPHAGLTLFQTLANLGEIRGLHVVDGEILAVAGRVLYRIDQSGYATVVGGIPSDGPVYMATNRRVTPQTAIAASGLRFLYESGSLALIDDSDLPEAHSVVHVDGFFVWASTAGQLTASAIDEGGAYDGLDFVEAEASRDGLRRVAKRGREVWALGEETTEVYLPNGAATGFPFSRLHAIPIGCAAGASVASVLDTLAWVDDDNRVVVAEGYAPRRISNHSVERAISGLTDKSVLRSFSYAIDGHEFYTLTAPGVFTWQWNATTQRWNERESHGANSWRAIAYCKLGDMHIVGDAGGKLYTLSNSVYDEAGDDLIMIVDLPTLHNFPARTIVHRTYLDMVTGTGLNVTDAHNEDPYVMMSYSDDGGRTFSNERKRPTGKIGEYARSVDWMRCGMTRRDGRIVRFQSSAAVAKSFTAAAVDISEARS